MIPPLTARPITIHIKRDLAEMPPGAVISLMWQRLSPRIERDYRAGAISAKVADIVKMVPRNQTELWPARIVELTWWNGRRADVVVSLDDAGQPLITMCPVASAPDRK